MFRTSSPSKLHCFIGDDLVLRIISRDDLVDLAPYSITSELRTNGGDGILVATFSITKDSPNTLGKVLGFTAVLDKTETALLDASINYGLDYKLSMGGAVQHSERLVIRFEKVVTA